MPNHWFTSDMHYGHRKIIEYSKRPYTSVEEMNEALIANYNSVVKKGDLVYMLGDVLFGDKDFGRSILQRLNGNKYLIFGNHDRTLRENSDLTKEFFVWARDYSEIKIGTQKLILFHYSMRVWNASHYGSYQLYGHSHGSLYDDPKLRSMDVGVDPSNYFPLSFEQVQAHMAKKSWEPIDHHRGEMDL